MRKVDGNMNNRDITVYQYGTTIRFEVEFFGFDDKAVDPETVTLKIYDSKYKEVYSAMVADNNGSTGKYHHDYVTEKEEARLYYEWLATINGKPSLRRGMFMTRFV